MDYHCQTGNFDTSRGSMKPTGLAVPKPISDPRYLHIKKGFRKMISNYKNQPSTFKETSAIRAYPDILTNNMESLCKPSGLHSLEASPTQKKHKLRINYQFSRTAAKVASLRKYKLS